MGYTKFKKHKNLGSLSNQDMTHIFGEAKKTSEESQQEDDKPDSSQDGEPSADMSGVKTVNSKMSMAEYFNSKKAKVSSSNVTQNVDSFKFNFSGAPDSKVPVNNSESDSPSVSKSKDKKRKRTKD